MRTTKWLLLCGICICFFSCKDHNNEAEKTSMLPSQYYAFKLSRQQALELMMAIDPGNGGGKGQLVLQHIITKGTASDSLGLIIYPYKRDQASYGFGPQMIPMRDTARTLQLRDTVILGNISISFDRLADRCFLNYSAQPNPSFGLDFDTLMIIPQWGTGPGERNHLTYRLTPLKNGKPVPPSVPGCVGPQPQQQQPDDGQMLRTTTEIFEEFHPSPPAKPDY